MRKTPNPRTITSRPLLSSAAVALVLLGAALGSCGAGSPQSTGGDPAPGAVSTQPTSGSPRAPGVASTNSPFRFFSASSFWNEPVAASQSLAPNSPQLVEALTAEIATEEQSAEGPWVDTTSYSVPVYTVPADQPTVPVTLGRGRAARALQSAFAAVPLPSNAQPAIGTDSVLALWQPSTDRLWEFWRLKRVGTGWEATWGGAMQHVSTDPGVYGTGVWPGSKPWWGSSASSLSLVGGLITLEDLQSGQIDHALAIAIPEVRAGVYASPAQRDDGKSLNPLALPEGAELRLNPNLDLTSLHLPHTTQVIAEAAQRYGIFVRDTARNVTFYAQDPIPTGTDPYSGPTGYFEGKRPSQLLQSFPWSELQVVKMSLHRNRPATRARSGPRPRRRPRGSRAA